MEMKKEKEDLELVMDPRIFKLKTFLIPPHLLTEFEIQKYQNEPIFNGAYSRDNLRKNK